MHRTLRQYLRMSNFPDMQVAYRFSSFVHLPSSLRYLFLNPHLNATNGINVSCCRVVDAAALSTLAATL
jgi:hypothetical protein